MGHSIYDNPDSMRRETWVNGRVVAFIDATVLCDNGFRKHIGKDLPFFMNIGDWKDGQTVGDPLKI